MPSGVSMVRQSMDIGARSSSTTAGDEPQIDLSSARPVFEVFIHPLTRPYYPGCWRADSYLTCCVDPCSRCVIVSVRHGEVHRLPRNEQGQSVRHMWMRRRRPALGPPIMGESASLTAIAKPSVLSPLVLSASVFPQQAQGLCHARDDRATVVRRRRTTRRIHFGA